jgi:hypothetical protein
MEWRFGLLRWSLASQGVLRAVVVSTAPAADCFRPVSLFPRAASLAVALAGCLLFFGLAGTSLQQPVHHWRLSNSNLHAIHNNSCFQWFVNSGSSPFSVFLDAEAEYLRKTIEIPYRWHFGQ